MKTNGSGQLLVTVVSGTTRTGLYAPDGSVYVCPSDGRGAYHKCGAMNYTEATASTRGLYAPDGSFYLSTASGVGIYDTTGALRAYGLYDSASVALFSRFTTEPSVARKTLIDTCIKALKSANVWSTLDYLYAMAAADAQAAKLNWISTSYNLTAVNSPTFTVDRGFTGDGASAYLATGANGGSLAHFSRNSANLSAWQLNNVQSAWAVGDTLAKNFIQPRTTSNRTYVRINDEGIGTTTINQTITDARGLTTINRDGASSRQLYKNGVLIGSDTEASYPPSTNFQILGISGGFTIGQEAIVCAGGSLTATQEAAKYAAFNAYLAGVGAV